MKEGKLEDKGIKEARTARFEWRRLLRGHRWLLGNIPFLLFLSLLTVLYIYNGHYAEKRIKDINRTASALKELQYEYKTLKSELMFMQKQSEVMRLTEPMGFRETTTPPMRLRDTLR